MASFRAACVQVNASNDMDANLAELHRLIREARAQGADLITTPENASMMAVGRETREKAAPEASHPALAAFRDWSVETGAWLLAGSLHVRLEDMLANSEWLADIRELVNESGRQEGKLTV